MKKGLIFMILMSCFSFAFEGSIQVCVHQQRHAGDPYEYSPSSSTLWEVGGKLSGRSLLEPFLRMGYSSRGLDGLSGVPDAFDVNARQWRIRCGADVFPWNQGFFFIRASAGASYYITDHAEPDTISGTVFIIRNTDNRWLGSLSSGLGSHVPLGEKAPVEAVDFVLDIEYVDFDRVLYSGGIEISL